MIRNLRNLVARHRDNHLMRIDDRLDFRRALRTTPTTAERLLWARLRRRQVHGFKFRRQHPVDGYVLDFYCVERRLAVEVDGDSHYVEGGPERDEDRTRFLTREDIRVLRFTNHEVTGQLDDVVAAIAAALTPP